MALTVFFLVALLLFAIGLGMNLWVYVQHRRKEARQVAAGLVPDKHLPPELREETVLGAPTEQGKTYQRRMNPLKWQERQTAIAEYWMEHPESRPKGA